MNARPAPTGSPGPTASTGSPAAAAPAATDCWPALPGPDRQRAIRTAVVAGVLDAVLIVLFAALGRRSHDEGGGLGSVLTVAAPFLIGAAVGWLALRLWRAPLAIRPERAIGMWLLTIAVGMVLRRTLFDRGTAVSFVIVATLMLGLFLLGWRAIAALVRRA